MKTKIVTLMILMSGSLVACSNSQFSSTASTTTTSTDTTAVTTTTTSTTTTSTSCSNSVSLTGVSTSNLSNYAQTSLSSPYNITLTVNLYNTGDYHFYGDVSVAYYDLGAYHKGVFNAPAGNNVSIDSLYDNGTVTSAYNYWYGGTAKKFSGFFQDPYGAIVLAVESVDSNLCATGKVYYKNFAATTAAQSPYRKCWFIRNGPYNCRADEIIGKTSLVPSGYTYLGSFSNLSTTASFQ